VALTPNTFWVDFKDLAFSKETGTVRKLDRGPHQKNVFAGNVARDFQAAKPFVFLGIH
jgi:choloylglycine hydrolase